MSTNYDLPVHKTTTTRIEGIEGEGWDFTCHICGYHACYIIKSDCNEQKLVVLEVGDVNASHTSNESLMMHEEDWLDIAHYSPDFEDWDDASWLSPQSRIQLEEILKHLDY